MSISSQAAPPLLASNLLAAAKGHGNSRPAPASSGSALIDERALDGGFRYGEITSIAGSLETEKTLLAYHAIASHILSFPLGEVASLDTTGSFSPSRLRDVLIFRLEDKYQRESYQQSGYIHGKSTLNTKDTKQKLINEATAMLDRVKVMRVFDFAGIAEAVGEVGEMREQVSQLAEKAAAPVRLRKEVGDSEEELDGDEDLSAKPAVVTGEACADLQTGGVGMIIIDTIANVVSALMSQSQTQGQALLASFMRSLYHLTSRYHICTILTNASVGTTSSGNPEYKRRPEDSVSIFSSTMGKPALGKTFNFLIDTSIFLSTVPKTTDDAAIAYGGRGDSQTSRKASVLEVLKDKYGSREGRWAAFETIEEVKIVPYLS